MSKFETTRATKENWLLGLIGLPDAMDLIIGEWTAENGGSMNTDDLTEMVEYVESIEWYPMASYMQGYLFGASTDDPHEYMGEQRAKMEQLK